MFKSSVMMAAVLCFLAACTGSEKKLPEGVGINTSYMDTTVNPGNDFFKFVNGGWLAKTEIPADEGAWGSFSELRENMRNDLLSLLKTAGSGDQYPDGSDQRKAADFFAIGMDSLQAERAGIKPIEPYLNRIRDIASKEVLQQYLAEQQKISGSAFFRTYAGTDLKKSDAVVLYISAGALGLPERDYYTKTDDKSKEIRDTYVKHVARMLELSHVDASKAQKSSAAIMDLETALAKGMMTKEERRNPDKRYNKRTVAQLSQMVPSIDWQQYFSDLGAKGIDTVIVSDPGYMSALENVLSGSKMEDIRAYLQWCMIDRMASVLSSDFVNADFDFNTRYLRGIEKQRPRWKRVLDETNGALGEALGKLYVEKRFPPEAKQKALQMVENIKLAFAERIKQLDWMSDSTKEKAMKKLSTFSVKIGYPDKWKDYSSLVIDKNPETSSYAQNVMNGHRFDFEQNIAKLGKPADRKEWHMTPQTVNAYYNSTFNEIVFPAAILQPPFYDYRADEAVNYGGIGAVIGHEISHGFDDQGSKFDADGNLQNWWSEEDLEKFRVKGKAYADQFSKYEPLPGVFVQGQFTLGENIGDLGGVAVAYEGLKRYLEQNGDPGLIDGYTPQQRFFISWATIWRTKYRDESLRTQVLTNPHSPAMYRANGPLTNMKEFYQAFGVTNGDKMYRPDSSRVKIW